MTFGIYIRSPTVARSSLAVNCHSRLIPCRLCGLDTNADNFGATFPMAATPEEKAVILAAVFLIDMMFFEKK